MLINSQPLLYLGRDKVSGSYYFLSSKEGEGRFLKYVTYPYWCLASNIGNLLDLTAELPAEILEDVINFVNGTVRYEIVPRKQGRAERVVKHQIEPSQGDRSTGAGKTGQGEIGPSTGDGQISAPRGGDETSDIQPKRRGRPKGSKNKRPADSGGVEEAATGVAEARIVEDGKTVVQGERVWPFPLFGTIPYTSSEGAPTGSESPVVFGQDDGSGNAGKAVEVSQPQRRRGQRSTSTVSQDGALLAGSGQSGRLSPSPGGECDGSGRGSATGGDVLEQSDQRGGRGIAETSVVAPVKRGRGRPRKNPLPQ
jgi:hypothetical protein